MENIKTARAVLSAVFLFVLGAVSAAEELKIVGTGDGLAMLRAVAVAYKAERPDEKISIPPSIGSGGGIVAVGSDSEVLGRVARPLKDKEAKYGLSYLPFARIPSAIFTHPSTKVKSLTATQLADIYAGKTRNWSDVGGANLKVKVVRREEADSTLQILRGSMKGWAKLKLTTRSKLATTTQEAIKTVRDVDGAIGFGPYSRPLDFDTNVLKIDGVGPTDAKYPSAVTLALIYKPARLTTEAKAFVDFVLSEKAAEVIRNYGGVPVRP